MKSQILFSIIPLGFIGSAWEIQKARRGLLILWLVIFPPCALAQMLLPYPFGLFTSYMIYITIAIHFIRKWSIEWNRKIDQANVTP